MAEGPEKRWGERESAEGAIRLILDLPSTSSFEIEGILLDWGEGGFRVAHQFTGLLPGHEVRFQCDRAEGRAQVIWNRLMPERVETGFFVLE